MIMNQNRNIEQNVSICSTVQFVFCSLRAIHVHNAYYDTCVRYRNKFKNENKKKDQTLFRFEQVVKENGNYNITIFKQ